jgi:NADP-dependent 3-hydroxy acid dehydrogenase YdfG
LCVVTRIGSAVGVSCNADQLLLSSAAPVSTADDTRERRALPIPVTDQQGTCSVDRAGVAVSSTLAPAAVGDDEWLHAINFEGAVHGVRAFLPGLLVQSSGASRFAVREFTESLRHELIGTRVRAITVHPGGVDTNIARNGRPRTDPQGRGRR